MEYPKLKARIVKIESGSAYEDKIYDQYVFIELPDGKILDLFDFKMIANPHMINKFMNITISVPLANVEKLSKPRFGIVPSENNAEYGQHANGHVFYGKIEGIDETRYEFVVETGSGKILVTPDNLKEFSIGDFVHVFAVRADLVRIS